MLDYLIVVFVRIIVVGNVLMNIWFDGLNVFWVLSWLVIVLWLVGFISSIGLYRLWF